jgi:hypothetical protein
MGLRIRRRAEHGHDERGKRQHGGEAMTHTLP